MVKKYYSYEETHRTVKGGKQKRCVKCKAWKRYGEFRNDRHRPDGLRVYCKACDKAVEKRKRSKGRKTIRQYLKYEERHRTVRGVKEKLCCSCNEWKYESCFHKNRRTNDGLSFRCKDCVRKESRRNLEQKKSDARKNLRYEESHRLVKGNKQKYCRKCNKWKVESEYGRDRSTRDGLAHWCRKCSYKPASKKHKK